MSDAGKFWPGVLLCLFVWGALDVANALGRHHGKQQCMAIVKAYSAGVEDAR